MSIDLWIGSLGWDAVKPITLAALAVAVGYVVARGLGARPF